MERLSEAITASVPDMQTLPTCFLALAERVARVYMNRTDLDDLHAERDDQIFAAVQVLTNFIHIRTGVNLDPHGLHTS